MFIADKEIHTSDCIFVKFRLETRVGIGQGMSIRDGVNRRNPREIITTNINKR